MGMRQLKISKSITNRTNDGLDKYLQEISRVRLVSPDEEAALAVKIKQGDEAALHRLINGNLRFVVSVAKQYQNQGLNLSDLINEGNVGLIKAAMRFDETKGFKFISFAVWWIRQSILLALAEQGRIVRLPLNKIGLNNKINIARQNFEQQNEREPSEEELSDMLDIDLTEVKDMLASAQRSVSMDSPLQEGEEGSLADVMCNPNADSTDKQVDYIESLQKEVQLAMRTLTDKQKKVVCYFFGIGVEHCLTLEDIGERFNLTRERVRQIKDKALKKMKSAQSCQNLKVFLG